MKKEHTSKSIDALIEKIDEMLIKNGYKPTIPANKQGTFVYVSNKPKAILKKAKLENNDINSK